MSWLRAVQGARPALSPRLTLRSLGSVIGIRREDKNKWERRSPLAPTHVKQLVEQGISVQVETSTRRVFKDYEYAAAGAKVVDSMKDADIILGVKEVPIKTLEDNKTYVMFSHTHKGQKHNMPLLQAILDKKIRLMDYELLTDEEGKRLVRFGTFAGYAGMIDFLHGFGLRLLALGHDSPFMNVSMTYNYRNLAVAKEAIRSAGADIAAGALPAAFGPMIFVFTGDGHVTRGAEEVFEQLPHKWVKPSELATLVSSGKHDNNVVYGVRVVDADYIVQKADGQPMTDKADYRKNPHLYESMFHTKIAPYATAIMNGIYWDARYPRLLTNEQARALAPGRLVGVADISCDVEGSLEFMRKVTDLDEPFFVYNAREDSISSDMNGPGFFVLSVDNLPAELPREASDHFSDALVSHVRDLAAGTKTAQLGRVLRDAVIADEGHLYGPHVKLEETVKNNNGRGVTGSGGPERRVLVLGSGLVAGPLVDYLSGVSGVKVTIGSIDEGEARRLQKGRQQIAVEKLDARDSAALSQAVASHDLVVSFTPAAMHPLVGEACLAHSKHLVTASYISPAMRELSSKAAERNLTFLNEMGLDPGIDHMTAMQVLDSARERGAVVRSFRSLCGGLPAPESSDNFLGYKLSWSPRGFLTAGLNAARWLEDGEEHSIPAGSLFKNPQQVSIYPAFALEVLPNRDSISYKDVYGLKDAHTIFRGTLRYQGFASMMSVLAKLDLFDSKPVDYLMPGAPPMTWRQLMDKLHPDRSHLTEGLNPTMGEIHRLLDGLQFLDIFEDKPVAQRGTIMDAFCAVLEEKLAYAPGERDMVMMHHEFVLEYEKEKKVETILATMIDYGTPNGYSSMARTVGLPAAMGARYVLDGTIKKRGVIGPMSKAVYEPVLKELETHGVRMVERSFLTGA